MDHFSNPVESDDDFELSLPSRKTKPEKSEHFSNPAESDDDFELSPPSKKTKEDSYEKRRDVEVLYANGVWY